MNFSSLRLRTWYNAYKSTNNYVCNVLMFTFCRMPTSSLFNKLWSMQWLCFISVSA